MEKIGPKVALELSFDGHLKGYTDITIVPTSSLLKTIYLNSRQCSILSVSITSSYLDLPRTSAPFSLTDPLSLPSDPTVNQPSPALSLTDPKNVKTYPELKRKLYSLINEGEEGELSIALPNGGEGWIKRVQGGGIAKREGSMSVWGDGELSALTENPVEWQSLDATAIGAAPTPIAPTPSGATPSGRDFFREAEFAPLEIRIEYELRNPKEGIRFVGPAAGEDWRIPHIYTDVTGPDAARCWVPCADSLWERCTWDLQFVVPNSLINAPEDTQEEGGDRMDEDDREEARIDPNSVELPVLVVASGHLVEQVQHPYNSRKRIFHFVQDVPTSVQHIAFAAGPFHVEDMSASAIARRNRESEQRDEDETRSDEDETSREAQRDELPFHVFCLAGSGRESELINSTSFLRPAMDFLTEEYGSYPFSSYKIVFVDGPLTTCFNSAALSIVSSDILHPKSVIEQGYETRQALFYALTTQWIGINIIQKTWADTWLINGLGLYLAGLCLKRLLGNNEYRFRLKQDMNRCAAWDVRMPPLCQPGAPTPPDSQIFPFMNLKAPLVLHILDRHLLKTGTSHGLSRVIPKLLLSAISGELKENTLSTHGFLRTCRKVAGGTDLKGFADQWIYGGGCPRFVVGAAFNRKKMAVELSVQQESPAWNWAQSANWQEKVGLKPVRLFEGQMTVRIHEADGTPYEHVLDVREPFKRHDVPFNTKYKRVRRNTKRFQARQAAAAAAAQGDAEAAEALGMIDMSFGLRLWEDEKERERWKVADWTEEEDQMMSQATYEWIRIDADFEWIAGVTFDQPDYMWISQLQRDRDVVAQLEAVHALARLPSAIVSSHLAKAILVTDYFFRVRMEAAYALVRCATKQLDYIGLFHLFKLFQSRFCFESRESDDKSIKGAFDFNCVPQPNSFTDFGEYFVKKALVMAISHVRDEKGKPFPEIQEFLLGLLKYNDNSTNPYSDAFYTANVMAALGNSFLSLEEPRESSFSAWQTNDDESTTKALLTSAADEIERYFNMDRFVPSYRNIVTVAGIEWTVKMMMANLIPVNMHMLLAHTREGNLPAVRIAAFDGILLLKGIQDKLIVRYLFAVLCEDACLVVRRRLAEALVECLPVLVAMDDVAAMQADEPMLIEEDGRSRDAGKEKTDPFDMDAVMKSLRKEVGRLVMLRDCLLSALMNPHVDQQVKLCLLKLAEVILKPSEEPLPKLRFRMPTNTFVGDSQPSPAVSAPLPKIKLFGTGGLKDPKNATGVKQDETKQQPSKEPSPERPFKLLINPNKSTSQTPAPIAAPSLPKKPRAPPKQLKAQLAGMSYDDVKGCQSCLKKLMVAKKAVIFLNPVDPVKDNAPDYFSIIKEPMDLSTMSHKLENGMYKNREDFRADFKLMIANAKLYNAPGSRPVQLADALDTMFDNQWTKMEKTLDTLRTQRETVLRAQGSSEAASIDHPAPARGTKPPPPLVVENFKSHEPAQPAPPAQAAIKPFTLKLKPPRAETPSTDAFKPAQTDPPLKAPLKASGAAPSFADDSLGSNAPKVPKKGKSTAKAATDPAIGQLRSSKADGISKKTKEKTSQPPPSTSRSPSKVPGANEHPLDPRKGKALVKKMMDMPESVFFRRPVDPVADGCPTYYDEIKEPMDLGTMMNKLNENKYVSKERFAADFNLIVENCKSFNPPLTLPVGYVEKMKVAWDKEWTEKMERMAPSEKKLLQGMLNRLKPIPSAAIFLTAVDPIALQIPTYFDVIAPRDARDLTLIDKKLKSDQYYDVEAFEGDVRLMLHNCFTFNGFGTPAYDAGKLFEAAFNKEMKQFRSQKGSKRPQSGHGGAESSKKVRLT